MKKFISFSVLILFICCAYATIWQVNNNASFNADFTQINSAVASTQVSNGDTLYVYGSLTDYSNTIVTKQLTVIGPGYFLSENTGLQNSNLSSSIASLTFQTGSEGSVVSGMSVTSNLYVYTSDISIINCYASSVRITAGNNFFKGCYFNYKGGYSSTTVDVATAPNTIITNCFFGGNNGFSALNVATTSSATVSNCVIRGDVTLRNTEMYNCIMYKDPGYSLNVNLISGNVHHNIFMLISGYDWGTVISDATNLLNVADQIFVTNGTTDGKYQLEDYPANPALDAGIFDDECGLFGGSDPYKLSGIPDIPTIFEFTLHSSGNTLPVRVGARAGN
jgi:hypothetical protein